MHGDTRGHLAISVMKLHTTGVDPAHHAANMLDVEGTAHKFITHANSSRERHFSLLEMKLRGRKVIERSCMIEVHMSDNHVVNCVRINADLRQCFDRFV